MLKCSKKGQMGMMELLMVLIIIGIIIAIGIYFFWSGFFSSTKKTANELSIQEREVLLGMVGKIPEIRCSANTVESNCIDTIKLVSARSVINGNMQYYANLLGFRSVSVEVIYPTKNAGECNENNYPDCGVFRLYEKKRPLKKEANNIQQSAHVLVSLYYPEENTYKVGKLSLTEYKQ